MSDTAHERVQAYINGLAALTFPVTAPDEAIEAVFSNGETIHLRLGDLQVLVCQAEALVHTAPHAAKIMEHSILTRSTDQS